MKKQKLTEFKRGWIIGNFNPSILKTEDFEVSIMQHKKGEYWPAHYHKIATEYNVLVKGRMTICNEELEEGDIFILDPHEVANPVFHEDCTIVCVKVPSIPSDKYLL